MKKYWLITADMGYGHQRAAYALLPHAYERVITANSDKIISEDERRAWMRMQKLYERISRFQAFPLLGPLLFGLYNRFQYITPLHPYRNLSFSTFSVWYASRLLKKGLCQSVISYIKKKDIPVVTTFFFIALATDAAGIKTYCVVTDSDINRVWVSVDPKRSNIIYLVPTEHTAKRLELYGVPTERIILTGFPLPKQNIGGRSLKVLKKDLANRLVNLDPNGIYRKSEELLAPVLKKGKKTHPLTLMFVVGGAGAQADYGKVLMQSLANDIRKKRIRLILSAGTHLDIAKEYERFATFLKLDKPFLDIQVSLTKIEYFEKFSQLLRVTDVLWTKTSELTFYAALGIPIIYSQPLGAHEVYNKNWLNQIGAGISPDHIGSTHEWFFELLNRGVFAKAAIDGYFIAPKLGTYEVENIVFSKKKK